jgi:hypothetical protein
MSAFTIVRITGSGMMTPEHVGPFAGFEGAVAWIGDEAADAVEADSRLRVVSVDEGRVVTATRPGHGTSWEVLVLFTPPEYAKRWSR